MPTPALPDRYVVDRIGTPDPRNAAYFVLDLVNDFEARVAVSALGRRYQGLGLHVRSAEAWRALDETQAAHQAACEARNPKKKPTKAQQQRNQSS